MGFSVMRGDITSFEVDAIVNAASESLGLGGGVNGAIHLAAGPQLLQACLSIRQVSPGVRCPPGESRITSGFDLPASYIIHTVAPRFRTGVSGEPEILAACYRSAFAVAAAHDVRTIAFPAIGCGARGYPPRDAAEIAVRTVRSVLDAGGQFSSILLVAREPYVYRALQMASKNMRVVQ